jgi:hypothetical protein
MPGAAASSYRENTMANLAPKKTVGYVKKTGGRAKKGPARLDQFPRHHRRMFHVIFAKEEQHRADTR